MKQFWTNYRASRRMKKEAWQKVKTKVQEIGIYGLLEEVQSKFGLYRSGIQYGGPWCSADITSGKWNEGLCYYIYYQFLWEKKWLLDINTPHERLRYQYKKIGIGCKYYPNSDQFEIYIGEYHSDDMEKKRDPVPFQNVQSIDGADTNQAIQSLRQVIKSYEWWLSKVIEMYYER